MSQKTKGRKPQPVTLGEVVRILEDGQGWRLREIRDALRQQGANLDLPRLLKLAEEAEELRSKVLGILAKLATQPERRV